MSHFREDKSITPYTLKSNVQTHKVIFLDLLQPYTLKCLSNVHLYQCEEAHICRMASQMEKLEICGQEFPP